MSRAETAPAVPGRVVERSVMSADSLQRALSSIDLDAMLQQLSGHLDPMRRAAFIDEEIAHRQQIAALAADFAADAKYQPLLQWMLDRTLRRPISIWGLGEAARDYINRREGANAFMWMLLQAVVEGGGEQLSAREAADP